MKQCNDYFGTIFIKDKVHINHDTPLHLMQLLAVSGPFHYWGPVVSGQYLQEAPARALQRAPRVKVDLLMGSSQDDGIISRAKAVKVGGRRPQGPLRGAAQ